ncbi:unnamed protein product [Urochloa decumbens]|uniref:Uncharacterized protein n=1 Tax=Urochloa decumbens TaxID=240449 RepID=A0ABC9BJF3_9POAL
MKATQVLLILAVMVLLSNHVKADCKSTVLKLGDECFPTTCNNDCINLGGTRGTCIEGPACNCLFCGPRPAPRPLK